MRPSLLPKTKTLHQLASSTNISGNQDKIPPKETSPHNITYIPKQTFSRTQQDNKTTTTSLQESMRSANCFIGETGAVALVYLEMQNPNPIRVVQMLPTVGDIWTVHWDEVTCTMSSRKCSAASGRSTDVTLRPIVTKPYIGWDHYGPECSLVLCRVLFLPLSSYSLASSTKHLVAFCFPVGSFWEHGRKDGRGYRTGERWVEGREEELWVRPRRLQIFSSLLEAGLWWWSSTREWIIEVCCTLRYFSSLYSVFPLVSVNPIYIYIYIPFFFLPLGLHCSLQKRLPRGSWIRV